MWSVLLSTEGDYHFKVMFLEKEFDSVKELLSNAPEFIDHYPDFTKWLSNALAEASDGKRLVYGLSRPRVGLAGATELELVGISIVKIRNETAELKTLFIQNDFRNNGQKYGRTLYKKVEEHLAKKGITKIMTDVPFENKEVTWFLIQQGFQINGLIDRYKKDDSNYILSKDVVGYYTGDNFDWHNIVSWLLKNIYQVEIDSIQKTSIEDCSMIPISNCNQNLLDKSLPHIKGVSLVCDSNITCENVDEINKVLESQVENVLMIFLKDYDENVASPFNEEKHIVLNENRVYQACGCPLPPFKIEDISGMIVEMKRAYLEKIGDEEDEFTYMKGSAVGKFLEEDDMVIFYVEDDDHNPGGLVGFGKVKEVSCGSPNQLWSIYKDRNPLFSEDDFKKFTSYRDEVIAIAVKDYQKISIIKYREFLTIFQQVIFTKKLGNMYINEDFVTLFRDFIVTKNVTPSKQVISIDEIKKSYSAYYNKDHINKDFLLLDIISACQQLQIRLAHKKLDENTRNSIIVMQLANRGYKASDQSLCGTSATGKSAGEVDIKIEDGIGNAVSIGEAFILKSLDKSVIDLHLNKIFGYDRNGLSPNFIIVYVESQKFVNLWEKYLDHLQEIEFEYPICEEIKDVSEKLIEDSDIKVALVKHERNGVIVDIYHIFINIVYN